MEKEKLVIFKILSSILILGNINFDGESKSDTMPCTVYNRNDLEKVAILLGV